MSEIVYRICQLLAYVLTGVPVGTNLGLLHILFTLLSGRFLPARGAVFTALSDFGLPREGVYRAEATLNQGRFRTQTLLANWQRVVLSEGHFVANRYEGYTPVACDTTSFLRPQLQNHAGKHYVAEAGKAVPAVVVGIAAVVGSVRKKRLALPRLLVRWEATDKSEADLQKRLIQQAARTLASKEILAADAGFDLADLLETGAGFVLRLPKNFTARRNVPATYSGQYSALCCCEQRSGRLRVLGSCGASDVRSFAAGFVAGALFGFAHVRGANSRKAQRYGALAQRRAGASADKGIRNREIGAAIRQI